MTLAPVFHTPGIMNLYPIAERDPLTVLNRCTMKSPIRWPVSGTSSGAWTDSTPSITVVSIRFDLIMYRDGPALMAMAMLNAALGWFGCTIW